MFLRLSLNKETELLSRNLNLLRNFAPQIQIDPLGWIGDEISLRLKRPVAAKG